MPTFEYQAQNTDGKTVSGVVVGGSLDQAIQSLSVKGLHVTQIGLTSNPNDPLAGTGAVPVSRRTESSSGNSAATQVEHRAAPDTSQRSYVATSVVGPIIGTVSHANLLFFFRQLSTMLEAGVPYVQSLDTLAGQSKDLKLRSIVYELKGHVEAGRQISVGLQRYPEVFSPIMVSMIRAGEEGGFLDQALGTVADYVEKDLALKTLYKRVTFYPKLEVLISIVIIIVANMIIAAFGGTSFLWSPLTQIETWFVLGPLIVAYYLFSRIGLANPRVKYNYDAVVSNVPYLGNIMRQLAMARFGRALGALHRGGVPIHRSVQLASDACGNEWLRSKMVPAPHRLEEGAGISDTLTDTGAFSPIVMNMVSTGEQTGNLDKMVDKMADYYEDESETKARQLATICGVCLTLLVCIYIGAIIINFWTNYSQGLKPEG